MYYFQKHQRVLIDAVSALDMTTALFPSYSSQCNERLVTTQARSVSVCRSSLSLQVGQDVEEVPLHSPFHHPEERDGNCNLPKS